MVTRLHLFLVILLSLILTSVVLVIYTLQRESEFLEHQIEIQQTMVEGAARDISYRLSNQILHVHIFSDEYREILPRLVNNPQDEFTKEVIQTRLKQRFPYVSGFTITRTDGTPVLDDIEIQVGDVCKRDIVDFSLEAKRSSLDVQNPIFIHPQPGNYHYDVMTSINHPIYGKFVFFVSFHPDPIANILRSRQIPGHQLLLVKSDDSRLIEISTDGARDTLQRETHLNEEELLRIKTSEPIAGTDWLMVDLQDPDYVDNYIDNLWQEAFNILIIVALTNLLLFIISNLRISFTDKREKVKDRD